MRLHIIRHAKAEKQSSTGRDAERLITSRGERQARHLGEALAADAAPPDLVLSSGILRAVQTARIIQGVLGSVLRIERALETDTTASAVIGLIETVRRLDPSRRVLAVVGHNPTMENLVAALCPGARGGIVVRTGECVVLEAPDDASSPLAGSCRVVETLRLEGEED
ncbi:MAG: histidine phosphatase family protein [Phycisphaeraceae bacterium]|nr:histidine phosphatase family protein [Phycisphaeraceae bacterium]